jgi:L-rhamnose mutarotase
MRRFYFALDLRDDPALIAEYERWHRPETIWPEVLEALRAANVNDMEILRCGNRLVMVIDAPDDFDVTDKATLESASPKVRAWEELMGQFQLALPFARAGEKWVPMKGIFSLRQALKGQGSI